MAGQQPGHYATVSQTTTSSGLRVLYHFLQTGSKEVDGRDICGEGARKTRFALLLGYDDQETLVPASTTAPLFILKSASP
jgi:hypothetical protein